MGPKNSTVTVVTAAESIKLARYQINGNITTVVPAIGKA
jgi:hypothetical protein